MNKPQISRETLATRLAATLRARVRVMKPGDRLPTEVELAAHLGGSLTKVREALTLLSREGIIERRQGSGTYVAELASRPPLGLFSNMDLTHPHASLFYRTLAWELRRFFHEAGLATQLYLGKQLPGGLSPRIDCPPLERDLDRHAVSGLIMLTSPRESAPLERLAEDRGIPVLKLALEEDARWTFRLPHLERIRAGLRHLAAAGCRRLGLLGWLTHQDSAHDRETLLARCRRNLPGHVVLRDDWVRTDLYPSWPGAGWEEFREIWSARPEKPDGLLIADDNLIPDVVTALRELRIEVPGQLRVAALTNAGVSPAAPFPMLRLEVDPVAGARQVGELMTAILTGTAPDEAHLVADFYLSESPLSLSSRPFPAIPTPEPQGVAP